MYTFFLIAGIAAVSLISGVLIYLFLFTVLAPVIIGAIIACPIIAVYWMWKRDKRNKRKSLN